MKVIFFQTVYDLSIFKNYSTLNVFSEKICPFNLIFIYPTLPYIPIKGLCTFLYFISIIEISLYVCNNIRHNILLHCLSNHNNICIWNKIIFIVFYL